MKRQVAFISALSLVMLFGCSSDPAETKEPHAEKQEAPKQTVSTTDANTNTGALKISSGETFLYEGQAFQITYFYQEFLDYLEKAEEQPDQLDELFMETVVNPLAGGDGQLLLEQYNLTTPTRPALLKGYLQYLSDDQETIHTLIMDALKESADHLPPGASKHIVVLPANPDDAFIMKKMKGVAGVAWNENTLYIQIAPPFLEEGHLQHTVAHEYQHTVLMENPEMAAGDSLLDYVMIEGKADTFARLLYPDVETAYSDFSNEANESDTWNVLRDQAESTDPQLQQLFFMGDGTRGLPRWTNYRMGNKIMDSFIERNPDISIAVWTDLPAAEILTRSKYGEKQ